MEDATPALLRAKAAADAFDAELILLRSDAPLAATGVGEDLSFGHAEGSDISKKIRRWYRKVLGDELPDRGLMVSRCGLHRALISAARELPARLIVIPHTRNGRLVLDLVHGSRLPVLLARRHHGEATVVAATDLTDARYPVLRQGLHFARGMVSPTVFFHNSPEQRQDDERSDPFIVDRIALLRGAAHQLGADCTLVVLHRPSTVDAIAEIAARCDADLIVVGSRSSSGRRSRRPASVAERVVITAVSSVLVVPVGATAYVEPLPGASH